LKEINGVDGVHTAEIPCEGLHHVDMRVSGKSIIELGVWVYG
jgi:hypothetical protein